MKQGTKLDEFGVRGKWPVQDVGKRIGMAFRAAGRDIVVGKLRIEWI
jgi:hypothetical protein